MRILDNMKYYNILKTTVISFIIKNLKIWHTWINPYDYKNYILQIVITI
jgi:hypothetical protein